MLTLFCIDVSNYKIYGSKQIKGQLSDEQHVKRLENFFQTLKNKKNLCKLQRNEKMQMILSKTDNKNIIYSILIKQKENTESGCKTTIKRRNVH